MAGSLSSPPKLAVLGSLVFALAGAIFAVGGLASLQAGEALDLRQAPGQRLGSRWRRRRRRLPALGVPAM